MDNSYGLLKVQEANLLILKEIDRICAKYKITYMLDAGTLLGAIRHGGFIPWDDDADIAMTRSSFEVFKKVVNKELPAGLKFIMPGELSGESAGKKVFYDFTPRVIYENSKRHDSTKEDAYYGNNLNHLWVDIFILDNLPDNKIIDRGIKGMHKLIYLFSMAHRYKTDYKKYSPVHKLSIFTASLFRNIIPMNFLYKAQEKLARIFNKKNTKKVYYSNYQPDYIHINLERKWVSSLVKIKFEDTELYVSDYYDNVLKYIYGDYMKLPAKEDRKPSHGSENIKIYG